MAKAHVFDVLPHIGIGPVHLGMTVKEADASLRKVAGAGAREPIRSLHYYFDAALQFELGDSGRIQFIGLAHSPRILCQYRGHDVFDTAARDLFKLIAEHERRKPRFRSDEFLFEDQIITLYDADEQYDYKGKETRPVWGQIGVGNAEYLKALKDL